MKEVGSLMITLFRRESRQRAQGVEACLEEIRRIDRNALRGVVRLRRSTRRMRQRQRQRWSLGSSYDNR